MTFLDALTRARVRYRRTGDAEAVLCCPFCRANRGEPDKEFRFNVNIKVIKIKVNLNIKVNLKIRVKFKAKLRMNSN